MKTLIPDSATPENFLKYFNDHYWNETKNRENNKSELMNYLQSVKQKAEGHKKYFIEQSKTVLEKSNQDPNEYYKENCKETKYQRNPLDLINKKIQQETGQSKRKRIHFSPITSETAFFTATGLSEQSFFTAIELSKQSNKKQPLIDPKLPTLTV